MVAGANMAPPGEEAVMADGTSNDHMVAVHAVLHDTTVVIDNAYDSTNFDFSGTRAFDRRTGYRSRSFLTVPLKNHEGEIIGVLQLINAIDAVKKVRAGIFAGRAADRPVAVFAGRDCAHQPPADRSAGAPFRILRHPDQPGD